MSYTLVEVDDLSRKTLPEGTDKLLVKTAAGVDQYALLQDILGVGSTVAFQEFSGSSATLNIISFTYEVGTAALSVKFNGSEIFDYTETNSTTVTLSFTPISTDNVRVAKRWVPPA